VIIFFFGGDFVEVFLRQKQNARSTNDVVTPVSVLCAQKTSAANLKNSEISALGRVKIISPPPLTEKLSTNYFCIISQKMKENLSFGLAHTSEIASN